MKKQKFLLGAAGLLALGLTACSNEVSVNNDVAQKDEYRYMRVAICSPSANGTRADVFADATKEENEVSNMYFKFFDRNGNCVSNTPSTDVKFEEATPENGNVGMVKNAIVKVALSEGAGMPAYVLCFINPTDWSDIESTNLKMEDFRSRMRASFMQGDYFSMNNSVYFGTDDATGATNVKISGTPIVYNQLYTTEADAAAATGDDIVQIYVERYAAKVQFTLAGSLMTSSTVVVGTGDDAKTLTFHPEAWTINADSPNMYAVKRYDNSNANNTEVPTLSQVNAMLIDWNDWNKPALHRSYWACSPGYYATNYPEVSDQIADYWNATAGLTGTGAGEVNLDAEGNIVDGAPNALKYYSYNQITKEDLGSEGYGKTSFQVSTDTEANTTVYPTKYVMENTVSSQALGSKNPKAAVPSVVMVGNYTVEGVAEGTTFYVYDDKIYYSDAAIAAAQNTQTMIDAFLAKNSVLYVGTTTTNAEGVSTTSYQRLNVARATAAIRATLAVQHPSLAVRGTAPVPHRNVTLQIANLGSVNNLYYSPNGTNRYIQVTAANVDQVNSVIWNQLQAAEAYTQGKCYFSIPIKHLGWFDRYPEGAGAPVTAQGGINWPEVKVGDFGLVRNHVYNLNVSEITGRATGILDLDYPLVPAADIDSYWIKYQLNILNWRVVPTQDVKLN